MSKIVFVPLTDEMVFERPDLITGPITAYKPTISKKRHHFDWAKDSPLASAAYVKGDLVNGLDVVYVAESPTKRLKSKKYRD